MRSIAFFATMAVSMPAQAMDLSLQCIGSVDQMLETSQVAGAAVTNSGSSVAAGATESTRVRREMILDFEMNDQSARIRIPKEMQPGLSATKDGWFDLSNLSVSDRIIAGDVRLNFLNKTHIEIDRVTGVLNTKRGFRAECSPIDTSRKKF